MANLWQDWSYVEFFPTVFIDVRLQGAGRQKIFEDETVIFGLMEIFTIVVVKIFFFFSIQFTIALSSKDMLIVINALLRIVR